MLPPAPTPRLSRVLRDARIPPDSIPLTSSMSLLYATSASDGELGPNAPSIRRAARRALLTPPFHTAPTPLPAPVPPPSAPEESEAAIDARSQELAIGRLRSTLHECWPRWQISMLGGEHAASQVPDPAERESLIIAKLRSCVGPSGGNADRDRRALLRLFAYCSDRGIRNMWPVSAALLMAFCSFCTAQSVGSAGGSSVFSSLRSSFVHMRAHLGLPVELDSPILFNISKYCIRQPRSPASTSIRLQCFWEFHASSSTPSAFREACRLMVIACVTSLRYKELRRARVASITSLILIISMTKDSSHELFVDAPLEGFLGPISWYPSWARPLMGRRYIIRDPIYADGHKTSPERPHLLGFRETNVRKGAAGTLLVRLCYLAAGISIDEYRVANFNSRSTRHLYPNVAEALQWADRDANEVGRWAAKLDSCTPVHRLSCAKRYAQPAMRATQRRIRTRIALAVRSIVLSDHDWRSLPLIPDFECLTTSPRLAGSVYFKSAGS